MASTLTNEQQRFALGPLGSVRERPGDRQVPVEADQQQVEHGRVAGQVVERQPAVAHVPAERPVAEYGIHGEQRHGYEADEEVGQRQTKQEVVADVLQLLVDFERHHHHDVAGHGDEAEHAGHQRDEHRLGQREPGHHVVERGRRRRGGVDRRGSRSGRGRSRRRRRRRHRWPRIAAAAAAAAARRLGRWRRCRGVQCRQRRPSRERVHCAAIRVSIAVVHATAAAGSH